jgi:hypothetical protein
MQIGIQYIGGLLEETELREIRALAKSNGYELKENDISGKPFALGGEFAGFCLFLSPALLEAIATGVISSASYDALKTMIGKLAQAISGKSYTIVRPGNNFTERKAKFYLRGPRSDLQIEIPSENADAIHAAIQEVVDAFKDTNKGN